MEQPALETLFDNSIPHPLWKVTFDFNRKIDGVLAEQLAEALEDMAVSISLHNREATDGDDWTITLTVYGTPDLDAAFARLSAFAGERKLENLIRKEGISAERLPEKDWLSYVHENFPPVTVGGFFIYGSHYTGERPAHLIPLQIDAATAFGSGEHETTKGCLLALEGLKKQGLDFRNALDMGCGSGILGIAMKKLWPGIRVTAIDIDPESAIVTKRHAAMNGVSGNMAVEAGDGYQSPLAGQNAPYDLIAANILADPLIAMAPDLNRVLATDGYCVLSGLLRRQKETVLAAHIAEGLSPCRGGEIGEWQALLLQKKKMG